MMELYASALESNLAEVSMIEQLRLWQPPENWLQIETLDAHTEGEPLRIILSGYPGLVGKTILKRRRYAKENLDHLRTFLMWEPRGHADMYGCIVTEPVSLGADFGVLFLHNEGYSSMCGHGIIAITKVAVETGMVKRQEPLTRVQMDSPAGLITAFARVEGGKVKSIYFHNVPSFAEGLNEIVEVPGLGKVRYDLAFGGAYYAYVNAADLGLSGATAEFRDLLEVGMQIKRAIMPREIQHPSEADLGFLYGTIFVAPALGEADIRNVCIFAEGEVDRSPTGTGVSGLLALKHARGELGVGQSMVVESIIGTRFTGRVVQTTTFGSKLAVIPEVEGTACITGRHTFWLDPADPLAKGFILR